MTDPGDKRNRSTRVFEIRNQYGIHARPAAMMVKAASRFNCDITVEKEGLSVSGKSIMGLMTLEAGRGTKLRVTAEGEDHVDAIAHLQDLFDRKFDED